VRSAFEVQSPCAYSRRLLKQAAGDKALYLINNGRRPFLSDTAKLQVRYAHLKFNPLARQNRKCFY
jgi:hypothetical protein